jgi:single-strand DNA-binding protein
MRGELGEIEFSHEVNGIKYYKSYLSIERDSGTVDVVPVIFREHIAKTVENNSPVEITGEFRSRNYLGKDGKKHLQLYVYAQSAETMSAEIYTNDLSLTGYICSKRQVRVTPMGRTICDFSLAVNRPNWISDYIPCIAWGSAAEHISDNLPVGTLMTLKARIQSREYDKIYPDGTKETKVAYEASVSEFTVIEDDAEVKQ